LQGISLHGEVIFAGWGRCDMGQLPSLPSGHEEFESLPIRKFIPFPTLLVTPSGCSSYFVEIWCGSEYTVACTETGELWSRGWREHGNLGHDPTEVDEKINSSQVCLDWIPIKRDFILSEQGQDRHHLENTSQLLTLKNSWNGKVACGGAHCIALLDL
jgi:alpha-tubulin suppressor-like RCC1 family protein